MAKLPEETLTSIFDLLCQLAEQIESEELSLNSSSLSL
ncbi:hypothetical protein C789_4017 [Microcystis aeruginosa FACHB-905 = DIANCHI905]|uniref:Uncharacterized protein n=1 Tax=Microcystis aeruginosa PCC 7806SL TaxID=1903187 RepID=A0AB33BW99_MICA7|nr:hypothetical protein BH695_2875 [Microcystis aeruginosa PCC 7806SL]ELS46190.1 hypothetical protein C789_4017 [Microcystis aeruginosa FACHB-905 = DIANCHI905]